MLKFISKIFGGSKSDKDVVKIRPLVDKVNEHFHSYSTLSNDELRGKTIEFRERIATSLNDINKEIEALTIQGEAMPAEDILGRDGIYKQIDEIKKKRNEGIEKILEEILPEAFAVVKEAGRKRYFIRQGIINKKGLCQNKRRTSCFCH